MVENKELMKTVMENMPESDAKAFDGVDLADGKALLSVLEEFPHAKNAFIETLTNKVAKSMIFSKIYKNPLTFLKKGLLDYGDSIEELFVHMAEMKNFQENWTDSSSVEGDLIKALKPKVTALYLTKNIDKKFKTTVNDKDLRKAFMNKFGLSRLVMQIVSSITTSINYHEFEFMKSTLFRAIDGIDYNGNSLLDGNKAKQKMFAIEVADYDTNPSRLVQKIRQTVEDAQFMVEDFNMAKVKTFSNANDFALITIPAVNANLDVNVLAHAFNVSSTDIKTRTITVDKLDIRGAKASAYTTSDDGIEAPKDCTATSALPDGKTPLAILIDKDFLQIWDVFQTAGVFHNPERQYTNHFASREYLMACCLFANAILFYK